MGEIWKNIQISDTASIALAYCLYSKCKGIFNFSYEVSENKEVFPPIQVHTPLTSISEPRLKSLHTQGCFVLTMTSLLWFMIGFCLYLLHLDRPF